MILRAVGVAYKCLCTRQYNSILHLSEADCTPKPCQREQMIVLHVPKEVCSGNPHCPLCYIVCPFVSEISQSQVLIKYKKLLKGTDPTSLQGPHFVCMEDMQPSFDQDLMFSCVCRHFLSSNPSLDRVMIIAVQVIRMFDNQSIAEELVSGLLANSR